MDKKQGSSNAQGLKELGLTPEDAKVSAFDPSEYMDSPEAIAAYMDEAFATGNARLVADSLGVVAKAVGMTELARRSGVSRQNLYDALTGKTIPRLDTFFAIVNALGLRLEPAAQNAPPVGMAREIA